MAEARSAGAEWRKSSWSGSGDCVEVAFLDGGEVLVRDSKQPEGPVLRFSPGEWKAFVSGVRAGELVPPDG